MEILCGSWIEDINGQVESFRGKRAIFESGNNNMVGGFYTFCFWYFILFCWLAHMCVKQWIDESWWA